MAYRARLKVRFGDIDHAGIVYYPRFLHYFHVALEEFFSDYIGIPYPHVMNEQRLGFPSRHLEMDFQRPLRFGDRIDIEIHVEHIGTTSIRWLYLVYKNAEAARVAVGRIVTVGLNMDTYEKAEIPAWLRERLQDYQRISGKPEGVPAATGPAGAA